MEKDNGYPPHTNRKHGTSTLQCCMWHIQPWNNITIVFVVFPCRLLPVLLFLGYGHEDRWGHFPSSEQWSDVNGCILGEMWGQQDMIALLHSCQGGFPPLLHQSPLNEVVGWSHRDTLLAEKGIKSQTQVKSKNNRIQSEISLICVHF